jgi:2-polyprenyl-6-methoxyphenol hydroxylase-like FAD-dependent oxidoreductase
MLGLNCLEGIVLDSPQYIVEAAPIHPDTGVHAVFRLTRMLFFVTMRNPQSRALYLTRTDKAEQLRNVRTQKIGEGLNGEFRFREACSHLRANFGAFTRNYTRASGTATSPFIL